MDRFRLQREDSGFTLVEIMVVVLIVAILMIIALPVFANFRARAFNREAQVKLRNLHTIQKAHLVDHGYWVSAGDPYILIPNGWENAIRDDYEPQFQSLFETGSFLDPVAIEYAIGPGNATRVCMAVQSKTGRIFVMNIVADTDAAPQPPRYGYTDDPAPLAWWLECQSGPTLSTESWD